MQMRATVKDLISPEIAKLLRRIDGPGRKEVLTVMGDAVRFWAMQAFTDQAKRPAPWAPKIDGSPSKLQTKNPTLRRSLRVEATANEVVIGSDRPYALIHQLGGTITPKNGDALVFQSGGRWWHVKKVEIPARPYLPISSVGVMMAEAAEAVASAAIGEMAGGA